MNEAHYGHIINTHYDYVNMLTKMETKNPRRFKEFDYTPKIIYDYLDKLQQEQNLPD